jgi:hypothetical protein
MQQLFDQIDWKKARWTALGLLAFVAFLVGAGMINAKADTVKAKTPGIKAPAKSQPAPPAPAPSRLAEAPAPAPKQTWTGVYVKGNGGYAIGELTDGGPVGLSSSGPLAGVCGGASVQMGQQIVVGAEACRNWFFGNLSDLGVNHETSYTGYVGPIIGNALPYIGGGFLQLDTKAGGFEGWQFGGGVKTRMPDAEGWMLDLQVMHKTYDGDFGGAEVKGLQGMISIVKGFNVPAGLFGN